MIVYVCIGNSDDKLTQAGWSGFVRQVRCELDTRSEVIHGAWFSAPYAPWQNACFCVEFASAQDAAKAREVVTEIRKAYRQDSVAWAVAPETEFV
jgi:hypothetical protein